jgi:predicted nucleotidyltransferase
MSNIVAELAEKKIAHPPEWLPNNIVYLTQMGSAAYGVQNDTSDFDVYGVTIPRRDQVFPHLAGEIPGFGEQKKRFRVYQEHQLQDPSAAAGNGRQYDLVIYNIVDYFHLLMGNNPNLIDSIFVPDTCILHITQIGQMIRENRKAFLCKHSYVTYKGYAYKQLHKMSSKKATGKRKEMIEEFGFDLKFSYHIVRLLLQAEMILEEGDLDLQRNREQLKAIRRGDVKEQEIRDWFSQKEKHLEDIYAKSKLRQLPDEKAIKKLLLNCLEHHYGDLSACIVQPDKYQQAIEDIRSVLAGL